ncbi:MAG: TrkH family potassium uptake protein [Candidatus Omnitrophica bacterium]|nr:TrkH family potassium uptake protein [Candidatus Omnitrophota bacterium]
MHKKIVVSIVARVLLVVSLIMLIPLGWAFFDNKESLEVFAFTTTILLGLLVSVVVRAVFPLDSEGFELLNAKDGLAIVGLSWIVLSFFGSLPFYLAESVPSFTDAFFETVSGFTTTGATIFSYIEGLPKGLLFWRSLTHWLGGMGIIVLFLALLPVIGQGAYRLYQAEAPGPTAERAQPRVKETAKALWGVYFILSVLETLLLKAGGMTWFDSLCHTFGTMATGGFSTKTASVAAFNPFIQWTIIVFMFLAGTNFILHYQAIKGNLKTFFRSEEFRWYFFLVLALVFIFTFILKSYYDVTTPLRTAAFQVVSILTTTGYVTADFNLWPQALRIGLVCLMFVGGCAGSTGGGMKVLRIFLIFKVALRSVVQAIFPNAVIPVKVDNKPVSDKIVLGVLSFGAIFILLFILGAIAMAATNDCDLQTAATASIACLGNIGPGLGKVGAVENYAWISVQGKWVLAFLMLAGRLELYSILILLVPTTWRK